MTLAIAIALAGVMIAGAEPVEVIICGDAFSGGPQRRGDRNAAPGIKRLQRHLVSYRCHVVCCCSDWHGFSCGLCHLPALCRQRERMSF